MPSGESLKNKPYRQPLVYHAGPFTTNRAIKRLQQRQLMRRLAEIRMKERRRRDLVSKG
jgi:hypothetical protein